MGFDWVFKLGGVYLGFCFYLGSSIFLRRSSINSHMKYSVFVFILFLCSCNQLLVQYYVAVPIHNPDHKRDTSIVFYYNFWGPDGRMAFEVQNNSDKILTINVNKSFFVFNGYSNCYFTGEVITTGKSVGVSVSQPARRSYGTTDIQNFSSVTYYPTQTIQIAPRASIKMYRYDILSNFSAFRSQGLDPNPQKGKPSKIEFTAGNSPYSFSNVITYIFEGDKEAKTINHNFFVGSILNFRSKDFENRKIESSSQSEAFSFYKEYYKYEYQE